MAVPKQLKFVSDDTVIEYSECIERENGKKLPEPKYVYKYIASKTKEGKMLVYTLGQLEDLIRNRIVIVNR